jgi:hypothetical protein
MDWWTGSAASHTKAIIARNKGDMDEYEKHRIKAPKLLTIFKFISLYLWLVLSHSVYEMAVENGFVACDRNYRSSRFSYFNQNIFSSPYYTFLDFVSSLV